MPLLTIRMTQMDPERVLPHFSKPLGRDEVQGAGCATRRHPLPNKRDPPHKP